ncbi:MAG TPA: glycosyltransferase family 2 protein [Parachlamydiaceae bacterium]|nr:glycosyltransferase family 2 protein [Parachlamydiaceae bacterium]
MIHPDLSVITVTYCSAKQIDTLIRSVKKGCEKISYEHILIDNGSSDATVDLIRTYGNTVICVVNDRNLGFSAANLLGYQKAKGRYLLFLNPDMEVEKNSLDRMVEWMDAHPRTGIAGCRLVDAEGKFNQDAAPRRFPKLHEQFILLLKLQSIFPKTLDRYFYKDLDFSNDQSVDSVRGSFMLMRREFLESVGWPFDPRYFIWFEDVDICREARKHGFSVDYTPVVSCKDAIGQSFRQRDRSWRFRQYAESLQCYLKKWEPFHVWCWVPLLYRPLALVIGSTWVKNLKFGRRT